MCSPARGVHVLKIHAPDDTRILWRGWAGCPPEVGDDDHSCWALPPEYGSGVGAFEASDPTLCTWSSDSIAWFAQDCTSRGYPSVDAGVREWARLAGCEDAPFSAWERATALNLHDLGTTLNETSAYRARRCAPSAAS